jgi:tetratricopeptide (TPR) repeat protein
MSDDNDPLAGLGDLDWDSALDEWEQKAFVPEVAAEAESKPGEASPHASASPPSDPALKIKPTGTLIAQVPAELRNDPPVSGRSSAPPRVSAPPPRVSAPPLSSPPPFPAAPKAASAPPGRASIPSPPVSRGGLNQLFSRPPGRLEPPPRPLSRPPSEKTRVVPAAAPWRDPASVTRQLAASEAPAAFRDLEAPTKAGRPESKPASDRTLVNEELDAPLSVPISEQPFEASEPAEDAADLGATREAEAVMPDGVTLEHPAAQEDAPTLGTRDAEDELSAITDDSDDNETLIRDRERNRVDDGNATLVQHHDLDENTTTFSARPDGFDEEAAAHAPLIDDDDDDNDTMIRDRDRDKLADADTATELPRDQVPLATEGASRPPEARAVSARPVFEEERSVSRWLDESKLEEYAARIAWLEEEAHAVEDPLVRGRTLLAVSELAALTGDTDRARTCAVEARDLAPQLPLAWRQARQLVSQEPDVIAEALDAEASHAPTPSARAHAVLLSADLLRLSGQGDAAVERWESACKLDPADTRGPIARAALALAQDDYSSGALRLADNSELVALDKAVASALRLRGVERAGAEIDDMSISDGLRHARIALTAGDVVAAAQAVTEISKVPELSEGALWLSAALGAGHIASRRASARSLKTLTDGGDRLARRQLAARGVELADPELVKAACLDGEATFEPAERAVLDVLAGSKDAPEIDAAAIAAIADDEALAALVDALTSLEPARVGEDESAAARASRVAGSETSSPLAGLGRLLASNAAAEIVDVAIANVAEPRSAAAGGVAIECAVRGKRWDELSEALANLPSSDGTGAGPRYIAAAIVAERAGNEARAKEAWAAAANDESFATDGVLRIASDLDPELELGKRLLAHAEAMPDGIASAALRLEGLARTALEDDEQTAVLEQVHRAAPTLGIGSFLAERVGRRKGDLDEVLRWIHERRNYATDPLETALDAVREALLVADRDPEVATNRLEEAHRARPHDVALRELHERLAPEPPADRGTWREHRAAAATGPAAALLWIEAALEHERAGDAVATLRAARKAAEAGDRGLASAIIDRAQIETGDTTQETETLLAVTKTTEDEAVRREAFERLAHLDAFGKKDAAAALLWHRAILESTPAHKPSLRWVEHALVGDGRDDELAPTFEQIALALDGTRGGETTAHAQHAARLRVREAQAGQEGPGGWEKTLEMARLAAAQPEPSLWALRALNAHSRVQKDDVALLSTSLALLERTQRLPERASLLLRASEAAGRLDKVADARTYLEQAASEDPGDVVTWGLLAEMRQRDEEPSEAAEACESLARTSVVREHQLLAWHDAAKIWLDDVNDPERAMTALEAAAEIDVTYADVFPRLSALYADKRLDAELARLLEKRLDSIDDDEERVTLEVELSRAFAEMGEIAKAKSCLESALDKRPDHTTALGALADLCVKEGDWTGAEQAYVRLARLITEPAEQRAIYERLGEIYSVHAPNLSRAEVALKEVLKRSPNDLGVLHRLVDVYRRQGDVQKAVETQQEIVGAESDPDARLTALVELARIHETVGRDPRRSEQVLDSARKEFPTSVVALRAMAEFYSRQRQMPAMQILLDRAAGDARRAFAQGRFVPSLFQVLHAAFELRGKRDAARVVAATLAAVEGQPSELVGGEARAVDPRLDDLLAPELMSPALRALLFRTGDTLDAVVPLDLRVLKATPLQPGTPIGATVGSVATVIGLGALQILVSPVLGRVALPLATNPPTLLVGEGLARVKNERARMFVVVKAMKMLLAKSSAMLRGQPQEVSAVIAGLFSALNPSWTPQGVDNKRVMELARRIGPALPRNLDPTIGVIALEAAGMLGTQWSNLGMAAHAWANRAALLAIGDPNAALDAIAWGHDEDAAPTGSEERAAWIARHAEARDLMTFSVTDAYAEARVQLGLER